MHLYVSPDGRYLYFLDTHNRKVGRVGLERGVDRETDKIESGRSPCA